MNRLKKEALILLMVTIFHKVSADKLEDGFERLKVHDYSKAKEYFGKDIGEKLRVLLLIA